MALPGSRDINAVDSGPLPASTVNNIQDAIVGRGHGSIDQLVDLNALRQNGMTVNAGTSFAVYEFVGIAVTDVIRFVLPLRAGDRLLEWAVWVRDAVGPVDRMEAGINEVDPLTGWTFTPIGTLQISAGTAADQKIGEVLGAPHVVLADKPVDLRVRPDPAGGLGAGNTMRLYAAMYLRWDHP